MGKRRPAYRCSVVRQNPGGGHLSCPDIEDYLGLAVSGTQSPLARRTRLEPDETEKGVISDPDDLLRPNHQSSDRERPDYD